MLNVAVASSLQEFIEEILSPPFGGMIAFVKEAEALMEKGQLDRLKNEEGEERRSVLVLICSVCDTRAARSKRLRLQWKCVILSHKPGNDRKVQKSRRMFVIICKNFIREKKRELKITQHVGVVTKAFTSP